MEKLNPQAIIFDLGSTLIEYEAVAWDELNVLCAHNAHAFLLEHGYRIPDPVEFHKMFENAKASYRKRANESLVEWSVPEVASEMLRSYTDSVSTDFVDRFFDAYYKPVDTLLFIYDDTLETLRRLRSRYVKIGLISNTVFPERVHRYELRKFGIEPFLDFAIFSSTFRLRKPHPEIFREACHQAGLAPEQCVYIGDRYVEDITGPNGIGMPAILKVKEGREYPADMPPTTRKINQLSELLDHLEI
ncbi:MAG: HAD family hydrolase [candidate division Zixibacteria bacterium]|nr:HAD family hydrolase [candidate division Zixibacteria bacterium]